MMYEARLARIRELHPELTAIRRDIHAHPELGLEEVRTAGLVAAKLREWGIETTEGVGGTGVVGTLTGRRPGQRAIGLRADMDALAIHEQTGAGHASTVPGRMHACGHDGHTTMLLGAARYLAENPDFGGTVQFIFQPAEEGRGGAKAMLADGLFERFPCDAIYGLHNTPGMSVGRFASRHGAMMAAFDMWEVTFQGTGGHGGLAPHLATDTTLVQANFIMALQTIVGRNVPPVETGVVSVGYVLGGMTESPNVIPSRLIVGGTTRSYSPKVRETIERRIGELATTIAAAYGCTAEFNYDRKADALINAPEQTAVALAAARQVVGEAFVDPDLAPTTGGEDFADMMGVKPGAFMRIGNGHAPDGSFQPLHTPLFDFNDEIIPLGVGYWVSVVDQELAADIGA